MKKLLIALTLPLWIQACSSFDTSQRGDAPSQVHVINGDQQALAAYLASAPPQQDNGLRSPFIRSLLNVALVGAAFTNPASGVSPAVSAVMALNTGWSLFDAPDRAPTTIVLQPNAATAPALDQRQLMAQLEQALLAQAAQSDNDYTELLLAAYQQQRAGSPTPLLDALQSQYRAQVDAEMAEATRRMTELTGGLIEVKEGNVLVNLPDALPRTNKAAPCQPLRSWYECYSLGAPDETPRSPGLSERRPPFDVGGHYPIQASL